ncbi:hypothetical protein GN244_ATG14790 [Phytophthora infestans]|uniref:Uncharacterized protein n=1 Tax=Phytophthora infestans TaxID=4787 RepID=A0A833SCW1_PHYIN|nr:hypothetical protein GN244_ATG20960 [Phytophthora infestans]KAF4033274.1 hypothetical protein GN244_ATG14790 [Phytophthora infestans]
MPKPRHLLFKTVEIGEDEETPEFIAKLILDVIDEAERLGKIVAVTSDNPNAMMAAMGILEAY